MTRATFRAGMVGAGHICEFHVAAVRALPNVELIGVCDLDRATAEEAAAKWDTTAFDSMEALVEAGANVIHVLTPPSAHAAVAMEALERGCHVLVEKPIAESVEDARRIGQTAEAKGLVASVDHSLLYDPQIVRLLEQVRAGAIGEVVAVDIFRSSEYPPYEGGPLPPHLRDAAYPWRDVAVHASISFSSFWGRRGRRCRVVQPGRRRQPRLRRMARSRAHKGGPWSVPALLEREAHAEPDRRPGDERHTPRRPLRDVHRQAKQYPAA